MNQEPTVTDTEDFAVDEVFISKTAAKAAALDIQQLIRELTLLPNKQIAELPIDEDDQARILKLKAMPADNAAKRYLRHVMKYIQAYDEDIQDQLRNFLVNKEKAARQQEYVIRCWRDKLINDGRSITEFVNQYSDTNVQLLRQLVRNAAKVVDNPKAPSQQKLIAEIRRIVRGK